MAETEEIFVSVVYALAHEQTAVKLSVPKGSTVQDAIEASGLLRKFPDLGPVPSCAIFGQGVEASGPVRAGDRVEILRPLLIDPKEARRRAAGAANRKRDGS